MQRGSLILLFLAAICLEELVCDCGTVNASSDSTSQNATSQSNSSKSAERIYSPSRDISLEIIPNRREYTENQVIYLHATASGQRENQSYKLILTEKDEVNNTVYKISTTTPTGIQVFAIQPAGTGRYNITVTAISNNVSESASITIDVISVFLTSTVIFLYVALGFFTALIILIFKSKTQDSILEILRFVFLSGIVASLLASLLFTDLEFGDNSPIGLVKAKEGNSSVLEWAFNLGGIRDELNGNRIGGLNIPVYVVVFGLVGGYLRYLYKTSRLLIDDDLKKERNKMIEYLKETYGGTGEVEIKRKAVFYQSLTDLSLFFLAPILAIVVWFLFSQWEPLENSPSVLAVFSFASGLVTNEIVGKITDFTKDNLQKRTKAESDS